MALLSSSCYANNLDKMNLIERELFGFDYKEDIITNRLDRVENYLFGATKKGTPEVRIKLISESSGISLAPKPTEEQRRIAKADSTPEDSNVSYPIIDMMEEKVFHKNYQGENVYKRLAKLEQNAFGKASEGELSERVDKLKAKLLAVKNDTIAQNDSNTYFEELEKKGYDRDTIVKLQLQDFGKMLINTPPEEKKLFKEAIKLLLAENKHQGIQAVFSSFANEKESCDFADSWGCSDIEALYNKDTSGTDAIDPMNSASLIMSEKSQEGMKELHNEMMERENEQ